MVPRFWFYICLQYSSLALFYYYWISFLSSCYLFFYSFCLLVAPLELSTVFQRLFPFMINDIVMGREIRNIFDGNCKTISKQGRRQTHPGTIL